MNETPQKSASLSKYDDITLKRGQIFGSSRGGDTDVQDWCAQVHTVATQGTGPNYRKDITIEQYGNTNQRVCYWPIYESWPSACKPASDFNGLGTDNSYEEITVTHEGYDFFVG